MLSRDRFAGNAVPFEGDRTLVVRSLPRGARITSARVTLEPVAPPGGGLFEETLAFSGDRGEYGATKLRGANFVEIDFHARRTLGSVRGSALNGATLQVDLGGLFIQVTALGTMQTPNDTTTYQIGSASGGPLPSLSTNKFKLTGVGTPPDLSAVVVRSAPSNLTLRLGQEPPFYARPGELSSPESCPDFARILQAFLAGAEVIDGSYRIPLVVHSDSIGRLDVRVEIEFVQEVNALGNDLKQAVMTFDHGSTARAGSATMTVRLPVGARVVPGSTTARVRGAFQTSRIVYGPTGGLKPSAAVVVSEARALATPLRMETGLKVSAVDLLLGAESNTAALNVDIVEDADGKPWTQSILPAPVDFAIDHAIAGTPTWVNVPLPTEVELKPGTRYWLVLQSLRGAASLGVSAREDVEAAAANGSWTRGSSVASDVAAGRALGVAFTNNGALSWRDETAQGLASPLVAFVHLRDAPSSYQVPIELQVGEGPSARRVSLERFQPLGHVDFSLDFEDVADAVNAFAADAARAVAPEGEHLRNGKMEAWTKVGNRLNLPPGRQQCEHQPVELAVSSDGRRLYALTTRSEGEDWPDAFLEIYKTACGEHVATIELGEGDPVSMAVSPDGTRAVVTLLLPEEDGSDSPLSSLLWIDLEVLSVVGRQGFSIGQEQRAEPVVAFSSDGALLYVARNPSVSANRSSGSLLEALAVAESEAAFRDSNPAAFEALGRVHRLDFDEQIQPVRILSSPDGSRIFVGVVNKRAKALELHTLDAATFGRASPPIALGSAEAASGVLGATPIKLSQSADGVRLVAVNRDAGTVSVIDTRRGELEIPAIADTNVQPTRYIAAVLSPDGRHLFAARQLLDDQALTIIDLSSGETTGVDVTVPPLDLAVGPGGERLYIGNFFPNNPRMMALELGVMVPEEWTLTSGSVVPLCLPEPLHRVAALGEFDLPPPKTNETKLPASQEPLHVSSISEVVPVIGGVRYALTFFGYATTPEAVAEIIWHGDECSPLRTDQIAFETAQTDPEVLKQAVRQYAGRNNSSKAALGMEPPVTRLEATSPSGAHSAEVRFTVPADEVALLDIASLEAVSDSLMNGDFQAQTGGSLAGWELFPEHAAGTTIVASAGTVTLRNGGADTISLLQEVPFEPDTDFSLRVRGRGKLGAAGDEPHVVLEWFEANGEALPSFIEVAVSPDASDRSERRGTSPANAAKARVTLELPRGSSLELQAVSLDPIFVTTIPISFVAQAPGDVTISDVRVAYEKARPPPPPVPARGLCPPSPPASAGGDGCCCHCPNCGNDEEFIEPKPTTTPAGVPAQVGECPSCGAHVTVPGGPTAGVVGRTPAAPVRRTPAPKRAAAAPPKVARALRNPLSAEPASSELRSAFDAPQPPNATTEPANLAAEPVAVLPGSAASERAEIAQTRVEPSSMHSAPLEKPPEPEGPTVSTALLRLVRERPKTVASAFGAARDGVAAVIREAKHLRQRVERRRRR